MITPTQILRFFQINHKFIKYGLDQLLLQNSRYEFLLRLFFIFPARWGDQSLRELPRGARLRLALEELGPIFVKFGQILSTRRDLLPDDIGDELAKLQDRVPPFSSDEARSIVETALGASVNEVFADFEYEAMASASVAQVHAATLHSGDKVVVKVLRPGLKKQISSDLSLLYLFAELLQKLWSEGSRLKPVEVVAEFEKTIFDELDMQREAANAAQLRRNFEGSKVLYIPKIYWEYTRKTVLVLERIYGISTREKQQLHEIGVDMKILAERGVEIFFTQVFRDNFFHADMHPGNILVSHVTPEDPSYIAVDFGIVGSLTDQDRQYLAENLLAFFQRDYRKVAQLHIDSGWVPSETRVEEFESAIRTVCEPIFEKPLEEISFGQVLLRLFQTARRFNMEVQPQLILLQKTLLNIEGMGREIYPKLDLWQTAKPFLEKWIKQQRGPEALVKAIMEQAPLWIQQAPHMPALLHSVMRNQVQLQHSQLLLKPQTSPLTNWHKRIVLVLFGGIVFFTSAISYSLLASRMVNENNSLQVILAGGGIVGFVCMLFALRRN